VTELIEVGETAPDFELTGSDDKVYRLHDVVKSARAMLVFYPGNNTPG
jgi:peroxiredoxin